MSGFVKLFSAIDDIDMPSRTRQSSSRSLNDNDTAILQFERTGAAAEKRIEKLEQELDEEADRRVQEVEQTANGKLEEMKEALAETKERALRSERREAEAHQRLEEAYELVRAATARARMDHLHGILKKTYVMFLS
ncbi:hypothetical protein BDW22DRAFT_1483541 [Trametopsis cervina]|nr:hypothetical protein BDW22DRAFT_1483541 [Trametopsis cervina]